MRGKPGQAHTDFQMGDVVRFKQTSASWDVWKIVGRSFGERSYAISTFGADEPAFILEDVLPDFLESAEAS